jgi:two-component system response regulator BaeR
MNDPQLILIVEDEPKIAAVLSDYLIAAGYVTAHLADGLAVHEFVRERNPSLILLDVMLPGRSGLDVCRELRASSGVAVIMMSARVEELDRLLGLELGADDYVCKPFSPREVVSRVKAVLRRPPMLTTGTRHQTHVVGPFVLDEGKMRVTLDGRTIELTISEYKLLRKLLLAPGRVFSRTQLLIELHGTDDEAFDRAIDTHIKNLRKRLGDHAGMLRSVYGAGYQLDV